jgi:signal transduction histidine kinase
VNVSPGRRGAIAFFVTFGVGLVLLAAALNVGWVVLTWRQVVPLLLGGTVFAAIIAGVILNTLFLVREIRRNEQHDAFVNAVTHELKTPVTSIQLHLETLRARGDQLDEAKRREFYDVMLDDSARLLHTINQVLQTGQTGRVPLHRVPLDLRAIVDDCVSLTRARLHLAPEAIRLAPGTDDVPVLGDEAELSSAILNLLDNAVKYSAGGDVDVIASLERRGDRIRLDVVDHGSGLQPHEVKRIFRRFYRVPGPLTRRVNGTGLGLYIVQMAARHHGGRAFATSAGPGRGSTFSIELPAAPAAVG